MRRISNNIKNHKNWLSYYLQKHLGSKSSDFTFKGRSGIDVKVPRRLFHTYKECFFDETYIKGFPNGALSTPPKTIVDIGANVGYFSLFSISKYPNAKVFAYEPIPVNFKLLSSYRDQYPNRQMEVFNMAVTKQGIDSLTLNYDSSDEFTTSATIFSDNTQTDQIEVKATSLKDILQDNELDQIDLLKLDCEGSEYGILYSTDKSTFEKIKQLAIETHPEDTDTQNKEALADYLKGLGYQLKMEGDILWAWR